MKGGAVFSRLKSRERTAGCVIQALFDRFRDEIIVILTGALPISEVRGAIPLAYSLGMSPLKSFALAVVGNMLPIAPFLLILQHWEGMLRRIPLVGRLLDWSIRRTQKRQADIEKYGTLALVLFVAVPLPTTGAWTASIAAFIFRIRNSHSIPAIFLGILIAATIVSIISAGVAHIA